MSRRLNELRNKPRQRNALVFLACFFVLLGTGISYAQLTPEFSGKWGSYGSGDGQFSHPYGIAVDAGGNVYVADHSNHRIQKFSSSGAFITKWGSYGSGDGQFSYPHGIAVDAGGNVYVADTGNERIQKISSSGAFITKWGSYGSGDGQFYHPYGIAVDAGGNVYVADGYNHRIQKFNSGGAFITKWGSYGSGDGQFYYPYGIAVDAGGNVYVADSFNHRIQKFSSSGAFITKRGSRGTGDGQFTYPYGIAVDSGENVYVADTNYHRIQKFSYPQQFGYLTQWGSYGSAPEQFLYPFGAAADSSGNIYVTEYHNHRVKKYSSNGQLLALWGGFGRGPGQMIIPLGVAVDPADNVYVVDYDNCRIQKFTRDGIYLTEWPTRSFLYPNLIFLKRYPRTVAVDKWGYVYTYIDREGIVKYNSNGGLVQIIIRYEFGDPHSLAVDPEGNIYVADSANHRIVKINSSGSIIGVWGGYGYGNGQFICPRGITVNEAGFLYVTDDTNRVQKFTFGGSFVSQWGEYGAGPGQFQAPYGVAYHAGNVYVAEHVGSRIQKFGYLPFQHPPIISGIGNRTVREGELLQFTVNAVDADGNALTYTYGNLPPGALFNPQTRTFTWTPVEGLAGTWQNVLFKVTDSTGLVATETITITVEDPNNPPTLDPIGNRQVREGELLEIMLSATDPDTGTNLTFSAGNLPTGATWLPETGTFSWVPDFTMAGSYQNVRFTVTDDGSPRLSDYEDITITVNDVNRPPVLSPIGDKNAVEGYLLEFAFTASDPDPDDTLTFEVGDLPKGAVFNFGPQSGSFTWSPDFDQAGSYKVLFKVTDNGLPMRSDYEEVTISVGDQNQPPKLNDIGNKTAIEGTALEFQVTATDPDADPLSYWVENLPSGAGFDPTTQTFLWTPAFDQAGNYSVTYRVTDDGGSVDSETITVSVGDVNRPPVLNPIGGKRVDENQLLEILVTGTDPDNHNLTYSAENLPDGAAFDPVTQTFSWKPSYTQGGTSYIVRFIVTDDGVPSLSVFEDVVVDVGNVNRSPSLDDIGPQSVNEGGALTFGISGSDPDNDFVAYSVSGLPRGAVFADRTFSWSPGYDQAGIYQVTFRVTDSGGMSDARAIEITVENVNLAPIITQVEDKTVDEAQAIQFAVIAHDPDGDVLTYSATGLPDGAEFVGGTFAWTPSYNQAGIYQVFFRTEDTGGLSNSTAVTVTVANVNRAPVLDAIGDRTTGERETLEFAIGAIDPDDDLIAYSIEGLPAGASFDPETGAFRWIPGYDQAGTYLVNFTAYDDYDPAAAASESITITVADVNRPPVFDPIGDPAVKEGQPLEFQISAVDPDGDSVSYSVEDLPVDAVFDSVTRTFRWTPGYDQAGIYSLKFWATDGYVPPALAAQQITVRVENDNRPPVLDSIEPQAVNEGETLSFTINGSDHDGDGLVFETGDLPSGAVFDPETRLFSWTPRFDQAGVYEDILFKVTDGGSPPLSDSKLISITVGNVNRAPVLTKIEDQMVDEDSTLIIQVFGSDPDEDALNFSASDLPTGAEFDSPTRTFSWRPTHAQSGNYRILFSVTDGALGASTEVLITVNNVNRPPTLDDIGNRTVNEGEPLTFVITAIDPDGDPIQYAASNLPAGALFDAGSQTFSWNPDFEQAGSYTDIRFTVTDSGGVFTSRSIAIAVGNVNRPPVLDRIGSKTTAEEETLQFTLTGSDPDGDGLIFAADGLPDGATFTGQSFSWKPSYDQAGNYPLAFSVQDSGSPPGVATEVVTITVGNVDRAPIFEPVGPQQATEGRLLQFFVYAGDPDGDPVAYTASSLPPGASFNPQNRLFSWTPDYGLADSYPVTFHATDGILGSETLVVITVNQPAPSELATATVKAVLELPLEKEVQSSYVANVKKVDSFIANGQKASALNQLDAFIKKVNQDVSKGLIAPSDAERLAQMASELMKLLSK